MNHEWNVVAIDKFDRVGDLVSFLTKLLKSDVINDWFYEYESDPECNDSDLWMDKFMPNWRDRGKMEEQ